MKHKILIGLVLISFLNFSCKRDKKETKKESDIHSVFNIDITSNVALKNVKLVNHSGELFPVVFKKKDGTYTLSSLDSLPIGRYSIFFNDTKNAIPLLIDNTDLILNVTKQDFSNTTISGNSIFQKKYNAYLTESRATKNTFFYQKDFVIKNNTSELGAIVLEEMLGNTTWRLGETKKLFDQLDSKIKNSKRGKEILHFIEKGLLAHPEHLNPEVNMGNTSSQDIERKNKIVKTSTPKPVKPKASKITEYAPYFYANNLSGNEVSVKSIFNKNKIILVDFWASWCVPCRAQTPSFLQLYNKYHSKGFEIVSISQDKESVNCQNAITQDGMKWINLIDNHKAVANMYHVNSIPNTFLVNSQGGILAKDIGPDRLAKLLKQHFGY